MRTWQKDQREGGQLGPVLDKRLTSARYSDEKVSSHGEVNSDLRTRMSRIPKS